MLKECNGISRAENVIDLAVGVVIGGAAMATDFDAAGSPLGYRRTRFQRMGRPSLAEGPDAAAINSRVVSAVTNFSSADRSCAVSAGQRHEQAAQKESGGDEG